MTSYDTTTKTPTKPNPDDPNHPKTLNQLALFKILNQLNLAKFYQKFSNLGVEGVIELILCEEEEFLDICSLVGLDEEPGDVVKFFGGLRGEWCL